MGSFFYFWPDKKGDRVRVADLLTEFDGGLAYLPPSPDRHPEQASTTAGPDGAGGGIFFAYAGPGMKSSGIQNLIKKAKKWYDIPGTDVRFSWDQKNPPAPRDVMRPEIIPGYKVKLGDGALWEIPFVRAIDGSTRLKRPLVWDGSMFAPGNVSESDKPLYEAVKAVWDKSEVKGINAKIVLDDDTLLASLGITRNHTVSPAEISARELLDTDNYPDVVTAMMGLPVIENLKKNTESNGQHTTPGEGD